MPGTFVGGRLRQLREDRRLSQAMLAKALDISPSYLNQLEHNTRPLTVPVLLRITEVFGVDASFFAPQDTTRLIAELNEVLLDSELGANASGTEIAEFATSQPNLAKAVVALHHRYRHAYEQLSRLSSDGTAPLMPYEQVRDFFYSHPYLHELDTAAEQMSEQLGHHRGEIRPALAQRLRDNHGVHVLERDQQALGALHRYDATNRVLAVAAHLRPNQQAFRLAAQLALIEFEPLMAELADNAGLITDEVRSLTVIGLANYLAAATLLPYEKFRAAAEEFRYDIERLASHFRLGFETVSQRLSTLQRPRARGVPFSLVRVDRAGNISKRLSATPFHVPRTAGTCPLWNVYEAFVVPGKVLTQIAEMPDGREYLWVARTVTHSQGRYGMPSKTFAVGIGCELRHAGRLVYSAGLDLTDRQAATPIGIGCKMCERTNCAQRAFPPLGRSLAVDRNRSTFIPYPVQI
jgi:predicted transcriptional regulator/transcriptional regulator with XRE-family HTH domain